MRGCKQALGVAVVSAMFLPVSQAAAAGDHGEVAVEFTMNFTGATTIGSVTKITGAGVFSMSGSVVDAGTVSVELLVNPTGPGERDEAVEEGVQTFTTPAGSFEGHFQGRVSDAATPFPTGVGRVQVRGVSGAYRNVSGSGTFDVSVDFTVPPGGAVSGTYDTRFDIH